MALTESQHSYIDRSLGKRPNGTVTLRDFDQGVIETLGARVVEDNKNMTGYYLFDVNGLDNRTGGVDAPDGFAGIPVVFSYPEDTFQKYKLPMLMVRRDSMDPAMNRWHPFSQQYSSFSTRGRPAAVNLSQPGVTPKWIYGYDKSENMQQAVPFDLSYTIRLISKFRGDTCKANYTNALLMHVLRIYQPYCRVLVRDCIGDIRSYEAFQDNISSSEDTSEVSDRIMGFDITLRIEAELDLNVPAVYDTVISLPQVTLEPA
jgi:hypothetical protein